MSARYARAGWIWGVALSLLAPAAQALPATSATPQVTRQGQPAVMTVAKKKKKKKKEKGAETKAVEESPVEPEGGDSGGAIMTTRRGPARVDFDDRLIQGQTNKSGAILIFERKSSDLHSMVRRRTTFREEVLKSLD